MLSKQEVGRAIGLSADELSRLNQLENLSHIEKPQKFYENTSLLWEKVAENLKRTIETPTEDLASAFKKENSSQKQSAIDLWHEDINEKFALLKRVGAQRARALKHLEALGTSLFAVEDRLVERVILEVTLIPYTLRAYFYEKSYWLLQNANRGVRGVFSLAKEIIILLFLLILPFLFFRASSRVNAFLEKQRKQSFYKSFHSRFHRNLTLLISVVSVYIPWFFALFALSIVEKTLGISNFEELSHILPYIRYYIYYKIFRSTLEIVLQEFASNLSGSEVQSINQKVKNTSQTLGLFLFFIYSLKTALHAIMGDSLIYSMIEPFFGYLVFFLILYISSKWATEVKEYLRSTNLIYFKKMADFMTGYLIYPLSFIGLFCIFFHYVSIKLIFWSSQFEIVKLIYAKVLRVKFETSRSSQDGLQSASSDYVTSIYEACNKNLRSHSFKTPFFDKIEKFYGEWAEQKNTEHTVAIRSERGSGKSCFLRLCQQRLEKKNIPIHHLAVPPRVFTEKSLESLFEGVLSKETSDQEAPQCILLDNAHNLFLSTIGGFQVYKQFLNLVEKNKNIFWIVTFNDHSWQFLNNVVGRNQYFRLDLRLPRWSVEEIKELVLESHKQTGYRLEYDQIFRSSQKLQEGVASAENRYFYLLWERSAGNPGLALTYWMRSLSPRGEKSFLVSLPRDNDVAELSSLQQDMHFVYASIIKHENLNISEGARATHLPRPLVKQAILRGLEEGFLEEEGGRYRMSLNWIDDVKRYLKGKNLIYETNG